MKPNPYEYKELERQDTRLRAFKERQWLENGGDGLEFAWKVIMVAFIAAAVILSSIVMILVY